MRGLVFVITVFQFLIAFTVTVALGWHTPDVRGLWPVLLVAWSLIAAAYACAYLLLSAGSPLAKPRIAAAWNGGIVTLLIIHAALFYAQPTAQPGVNSETTRPSLIQRAVRSDATFYLILLFGLAGPTSLRIALFAGRQRQ